jgi:hypothetical protein
MSAAILDGKAFAANLRTLVVSAVAALASHGQPGLPSFSSAAILQAKFM